jgi:hypothetical protein
MNHIKFCFHLPPKTQFPSIPGWQIEIFRDDDFQNTCKFNCLNVQLTFILLTNDFVTHLKHNGLRQPFIMFLDMGYEFE